MGIFCRSGECHRRGTQPTLAGVAFGDPAHRLSWTIVLSFALGFAGATLDLVIDGWRITSVRPPEKQGHLHRVQSGHPVDIVGLTRVVTKGSFRPAKAFGSASKRVAVHHKQRSARRRSRSGRGAQRTNFLTLRRPPRFWHLAAQPGRCMVACISLTANLSIDAGISQDTICPPPRSFATK